MFVGPLGHLRFIICREIESITGDALTVHLVSLDSWGASGVSLKPPLLLSYLSTVFGLPQYGDALGRLKLLGLVAIWLPELDGPHAGAVGLPEHS